MAMTAYFDESGTHGGDSPVMIVAGFGANAAVTKQRQGSAEEKAKKELEKAKKEASKLVDQAREDAKKAVEESRNRKIRVVTLHASRFGKPIYEKFGFEQTDEMRLINPS